MHTPSRTLEGGPYGIKWPVLLLLHIRLNMMALRGLASGAGGIRKPDYYETLRPQFSPREEGLWLLAAHTIGTALLKSTKTLMSSVAERAGTGGIGSEDTLEGLIVSLDEVCVFGAPGTENEWEVGRKLHVHSVPYFEQLAEIEPQEWHTINVSTTRKTRSSRRKRSGSGEGVSAKKLRSNVRKQQDQQAVSEGGM
jgi:hypothetical protein